MFYNQCQKTNCEHFGGLPICRAASDNVKKCNEYIHPQDRIEKIQRKLRKFSIERDFQKIHFPKSLIMAMTSEIGELAHICRWKTEAEILMLKDERLQKIKDELADIMICALNFAQIMDIDLCEVINAKIKMNERKYSGGSTEPVPSTSPTPMPRYTDNGNGTITDHTTGLMWQKGGSDGAIGLMWQKGGSDDHMENDATKNYIEKLNKDRFAGHTDWRLPTLAELKTLLEPEEQSNGLYIDPIFDKKQEWCWVSDDEHRGGGAWVVNFLYGCVNWFDSDYNYVRAVRIGQ